MGVRRGGQEGELAPTFPLGRPKLLCFSTYLKENSKFLGIYLGK